MSKGSEGRPKVRIRAGQDRSVEKSLTISKSVESS